MYHLTFPSFLLTCCSTVRCIRGVWKWSKSICSCIYLFFIFFWSICVTFHLTSLTDDWRNTSGLAKNISRTSSPFQLTHFMAKMWRITKRKTEIHFHLNTLFYKEQHMSLLTETHKVVNSNATMKSRKSYSRNTDR